MRDYRVSEIVVRLLLIVVLCLGFVNTTQAAVVFDFSLPANGDVGAIDIQLTFPDFPIIPGLQVFVLTDAIVTSFSSATPIDPSNSVIGLDVTATNTLIGVGLLNAAVEPVLLTVDYPADFFVFGRLPTDAGLFASSSGLVTSFLDLDTTSPTGSLNVTSDIPEPATSALLGLGLLGMVGVFARKKR